ncbi:hypothetical protein IAT40_007337 [Kwoniella sp. CBS 6097]
MLSASHDISPPRRGLRQRRDSSLRQGHTPDGEPSTNLRLGVEAGAGARSNWTSLYEKEISRSLPHPSCIWAPLVLSTCTSTTPTWYAPSVAARSSMKELYGEELIYPEFALPPPLFGDHSSRERWFAAAQSIKDRASVRDDGYLLYRSQHGQNWKALELMSFPWAVDESFDTSTKKTVVYMSRSNGLAANGGRQVVNERKVLRAIENLLVERGKGETLQIYNDASYGTVDELMEFFSKDVLAIVGPHGGALMNHRFAGPGTLLLEFLPTSRMETINYEEASMLNQTYAAIVVEPSQGTRDDMEINPEDVRTILDRNLGKQRIDNIQLGLSCDNE